MALVLDRLTLRISLRKRTVLWTSTLKIQLHQILQDLRETSIIIWLALVEGIVVMVALEVD